MLWEPQQTTQDNFDFKIKQHMIYDIGMWIIWLLYMIYMIDNIR